MMLDPLNVAHIRVFAVWELWVYLGFLGWSLWNTDNHQQCRSQALFRIHKDPGKRVCPQHQPVFTTLDPINFVKIRVFAVWVIIVYLETKRSISVDYKQTSIQSVPCALSDILVLRETSMLLSSTCINNAWLSKQGPSSCGRCMRNMSLL